jgi:hypothetical protein
MTGLHGLRTALANYMATFLHNLYELDHIPDAKHYLDICRSQQRIWRGPRTSHRIVAGLLRHFGHTLAATVSRPSGCTAVAE